ncbi:MAG TPA: ribosome biogenesis GTP-binding protein YihA/YsxC [Pseudothermotoga sp.]|nr:ribosome biogenesis GTP-binding protein YihA/YsxC [Pseudothermotoga sp.]HOK84332.1 ribosome biogenesis GTP-binding protein YihA/YsxC [Pseudothermotoga sp.]HPP70744.1 ribosome biogenesis GTP-binding protein YihA/YsxC [Pseudothermotoga sp.]
MFVKTVEFVVSAYREDDFPQALHGEVCFVGRSNVGKSTLLNVLFNRRLAKVSKRPGKTRSINFYKVNNRYYFVDLPGYGYAEVSKSERVHWKNLIETYFENRNDQIKLSVLLIDCRLSPQENDKMFVEWSQYYRVPVLVVLSKVDKLGHQEISRKIEVVRQELGTDVIAYSAITKRGVSDIIEKINRCLV